MILQDCSHLIDVKRLKKAHARVYEDRTATLSKQKAQKPPGISSLSFLTDTDSPGGGVTLRSQLGHFLFMYLPYIGWRTLYYQVLNLKTTTPRQYLKSVIFFSVGLLTPGSYMLRKKYTQFYLVGSCQ